MRAPGTVMRLDRMGASHQTRLSFMRQLTRRMQAEGWTTERTAWAVDGAGVGHAVYVVRTPRRAYSLVAFAHDLPPASRSDRVIAEAWDATFALVDGVATARDVARLSGDVPKQEAGRVTARELCLSRANRSARLWDHVVGRLAAGAQPDADRLAEVGYLMRTTAVYGSGKFGAADRAAYDDRPEMAAPFQAEMLTVWLIRTFVRDLVEHMARARSPGAVPLDPDLARGLGIGNSTGLGMAPFLMNHPRLIHRWIAARETALARVRAVERATPEARDVFAARLASARRNAEGWRVADPVLAAAVAGLRADLAAAAGWGTDGPFPWAALLERAGALGLEAQEALAALVLEPYGDLVDDLGPGMADVAAPARLDGTMTVAAMRAAVEAVHGAALRADWSDPAETARLWYVSAEKAEPRLAERADEPLEAWEQPLGPQRDAAALRAALDGFADCAPVAEVALARPDLRAALLRAQVAAAHAYAEIRDNTLAGGMRPIDLLRAKLSFFGATRFDPRSDRWLRICLYAGAPYPDEIAAGDADAWVYP
ncbi:hypothetical protein JQC91_04010 [Jannaschia sp. Os4]|uniref:hypothetical protein n=1 Tax=Jannaschia sp. Os4 TaxID=2807617 RepID=UPI001939902A|nr:hypothetical protein [Jannaschia sp. Os4]MBM2575459.1 hypothetical protein [Jannaschia sp. Os4]